MKNFLKQCETILTITIIISLCFILPIYGDKEKETDNMNIEIEKALGPEFVEKMIQQEKAVEAYQLFCDSFRNDDILTPVFPDNYAGNYIIDNILHIYYSEYNDNLIDAIPSDYLDIVQFDLVKYGGKVLDSYYAKAIDYLPEFSYTNLGVSVLDNKVVIETNISENVSYINKIITVNDLDEEAFLVKYINGSGNIPCTTDIHGGDKLTSKTLSVCGLQGSYPSIITCAHNSAYVGETLYLYGSSNSLATVTTVCFQHNHYGDFAIAEINSSLYNTTKKMRINNTTYVDCYDGAIDIANGENLVKYGANGGYAAITVTALSQTINYSTNVTIKGLHKANIIAGTVSPGDSGGPIIRYMSSNQKYYYCGLVCTRHLDNNNNVDYMTFCPYSLMASEFVPQSW